MSYPGSAQVREGARVIANRLQRDGVDARLLAFVADSEKGDLVRIVLGPGAREQSRRVIVNVGVDFVESVIDGVVLADVGGITTEFDYDGQVLRRLPNVKCGWQEIPGGTDVVPREDVFIA